MAAKERGFEGMYSLLTSYQLFKEKEGKRPSLPFLKVELDLANHTLSYYCHKFYPPLIWSSKQEKLISPKRFQTQLAAGDFFFLFNPELVRFFEGPEQLKNLFAKVLKYFAVDGLDTCVNVLEKELFFAAKRKELEDDINLIAFQLLY